ncbi:MAG: efflux RND transporter periplasmic adaptor subunit [Candidatus Bruticola sp.]
MNNKYSNLRVPVGMILVAATLLSGGVGCSQNNSGEEKKDVAVNEVKASNVELDVTRLGSIVEETTITGHLNAVNKADIVSRVNGRVVGVYVREGDRVSKGQILVQLDDTVQKNTVSSAQASLAQAKAGLTQALANYNAAKTRVGQAQESMGMTDVSSALEVQKARQGVVQAQTALASAQADYDDALLNMHRQQDLYAKDAVSSYAREQAELRERTSFQSLTAAKSALSAANESLRIAKTAQRQVNILHADVKTSRDAVAQAAAAVDQAKANVQAAQAAYDSAVTNLNDMAIKSPIDGVVTARNVEVGAFASDGSGAVCSVVDNSNLEMISSLDEKFAPFVKAGSNLILKTSIVDEVPAVIVDVVPASDPTSHTIKVRLNINNDNNKLLDGTYAEALMPVRELKGVIVPRTAVNMAVGSVFVVQYEGDGDTGTAKKVPITMVYSNGKEALVDGVDVGQKVVTSGGLDILDGQPLKLSASKGDEQQ